MIRPRSRHLILLTTLLLLAAPAGASSVYGGWAVAGFELTIDPRATLDEVERNEAEALLAKAAPGLAFSGRRDFLGRSHPDFSEKLLAADRARVALFLARRGFPLAESRVEYRPVPEERRLRLELLVIPGPMHRIVSIRASGLPEEEPLAYAADSLCASRADGRRFSDDQVQEIGADLVELLRERGYARVEVNSSAVLPDSAKVDLHYVFTPGERYRFGGLKVEGVDPDLVDLADRHLAFLEGRDYSPSLLRRAQFELRELQLFRRIDLRAEPAGEDTLRVDAALAPRKPRSTRLAVGTWSDHLWRIKASWRHRNLFRRGRGFLLRGAWSPEQREAATRAWWPGMPWTRTRMDLGLSYVGEREDSYSQDTAAVELGLLLTPWRPWQERWRLSLGFARVRVDDLTSAEDAFEAGVGGLLTLAVEYRLDRSDAVLEPGRGFRFQARGEISPPGFLSDYPFASGQARISAYRPLGATVLALRLGLGLARPLGDAERLLPAKRIFAGGTSSMRGHRRRELGPRDTDDGPLGGRVRLLAAAEIRLPLFWKLGSALFCDAGQVWARSSAATIDDLALAAGPGLWISTPVGAIRADCAFNLREAPDDWVLHLSIGHPW